MRRLGIWALRLLASGLRGAADRLWRWAYRASVALPPEGRPLSLSRRTIAQMEGPFTSTRGVVYNILVAEGEKRYRAKVVAPRLLTQPELDQRLRRILEYSDGSNQKS